MKEKLIWWGVIIIGTVLLVLYVSKSPARGKITYKTDKLVTPTPMEYIRYDGRDLSFAYENKYQLNDNGSVYELVGNTGVSGHIVISINQATAGVEELSGVLMRRVKPAEYTEEKINWGDTKGLLFRRNDRFEQAAFFQKNGKTVTVAMTAGSNDEAGLREEFQKVVDSMEIKI